MDYYELPAEGRGYYMFDHRPLMNAKAHFHSAVEFIFMEKGYAEVNVGGERRLLSAARPASRTAFAYIPTSIIPTISSMFFSVTEIISTRFSANVRAACFRDFSPFPILGFCKPYTAFAGFRAGTGPPPARYSAARRRFCSPRSPEKIPLVKRENDKQSAFVCEILKYAQSHVEEELSLSVLSDRFGYSREHLSRILHKYLTETWNAYVNGLRVQKAEALLKADEEKNVLKIAYECGFDSQNTFYRAYKKEFGHLPRRAVGTKEE